MSDYVQAANSKVTSVNMINTRLFLKVYLCGNRIFVEVVAEAARHFAAPSKKTNQPWPARNNRRRLGHERRGSHALPIDHRSIHLGTQVRTYNAHYQNSYLVFMAQDL